MSIVVPRPQSNSTQTWCQCFTFRKPELQVSRHVVTLPTELWLLIFHHVLDTRRVPNTFCTPRRPFTSHHQVLEYQNFKRTDDEWSRLRLVCRSWAKIVGLRPTLYIARGKYSLLSSIISTPTTRDLLTSLILEGNYTDGYTINLLLDNAHVLQGLRSLSILSNPRDPVPNFWPRLCKGFPSLIHLNVDVYVLYIMSITFRHLESLVITGYSVLGFSAVKHYLPSLKHLAIVSSNIRLEDLLINHGHLLQSLKITPDCAFTYISPDFWDWVPNLLVLDIHHRALQRLRPIPPGHPLQQICVHSFPVGLRQLDNVTKMLSDFPQVTRVYLGETLIPTSNFRSMQRIASRRGVEFDLVPWDRSYQNMSYMTYGWHRLFHYHRQRDLLLLPLQMGVALCVIVMESAIIIKCISVALAGMVKRSRLKVRLAAIFRRRTD